MNIDRFNSIAQGLVGHNFEGSEEGGPKITERIQSISFCPDGVVIDTESLKEGRSKAKAIPIFWSLKEKDFPATETETEIVFRNGWRITK